MNLPEQNFLAGPFWLITVLHIFTLTLHFLAMNFLVGGIIFLLFNRDRLQESLKAPLIKLFPGVMATTVTLGVAPLLFVQLVYHRQVYSAAIVSAWLWLAIIAAALVAYYLLYGAAFRLKQAGKGTLLWLSVPFLLFISIVYVSVFSLAEKPGLIHSLYSEKQSGTLINPQLGTYIFRWLHMLFAALAVGSFCAMLLGKYHNCNVSTARRFFLYSMGMTAIAGTLYLLSFDKLLPVFMRSNGIWLLVLSVLLAGIAFYFVYKSKLLAGGASLVISMFGMVSLRHYVRYLKLEDSLSSLALSVRPQWSILVIFFVCLVVSAAVIAYMFRLFLKSTRS